ncbi:hypothetical protein A2643_01020 [Candidatus Nomurabacteria bacterium RIFCSPHIGHO2_01_FULL_39_220]|uniref:HD domain-containing protein n=1 Tax=Candidatus Nomurabacteria bacterium RIFCSPLOWO2_02_FULL_40_67 TaxID=1801787 RepID=A0A1F6Y710_9BACT|nr:MAG: phosphohydrolase [Parcubacteria group bacterium GW2011_GWB1_41_5]KKS70768.1 MAG: phosphohydrolase [Parcubacteria group bacterium GW2011_GWF2_42_7]OGI61797.1 MAG: hypothetical protein A2W12_00580 [Candidatus Nomurabacteria bacterium RBG_16_40_11]OGI70637.1 MAG: hypothetical protein A2643_01020 [Candidatus Nomurabacteria bacterium RIFCSPHIGHO2_01_FULL_39_220]OGI78990.1 MAG: hypothetical protein A3C65_01130 [Candidatus Nomurabacteria bacterium RIFCSPHIGHO2_02_FULL_41_150]OGI81972.1 MAG: h
MSKKKLAKWSDKYVMKETKALRVAYQLKRTLRYFTKRDFSVHSESVAEHLFALHYLALYFQPLEDPDYKLDMERIHQIITFHDFGEMLHGDIPYHLKTKEHEAQERKDAKIIFNSLPVFLRKIAKDNWKDYLERRSKEAQFICALDKIEPLFELLDPVSERSLKRLKHSYGKDFDKKFRATEHFPIMRRFVEVISQDMLARKIFWEN